MEGGAGGPREKGGGGERGRGEGGAGVSCPEVSSGGAGSLRRTPCSPPRGLRSRADAAAGTGACWAAWVGVGAVPGAGASGDGKSGGARAALREGGCAAPSAALGLAELGEAARRRLCLPAAGPLPPPAACSFVFEIFLHLSMNAWSLILLSVCESGRCSVCTVAFPDARSAPHGPDPTPACPAPWPGSRCTRWPRASSPRAQAWGPLPPHRLPSAR